MEAFGIVLEENSKKKKSTNPECRLAINALKKVIGFFSSSEEGKVSVRVVLNIFRFCFLFCGDDLYIIHILLSDYVGG